MQKLLVTVTVLFAVLTIGLMMGCSDDNPSIIGGQGGNEVASIELRITHNLIRGFVGEERQETITAIARNANGVGMPNVMIDFGIQNPESYKGTLAMAGGDSAMTNSNGEITASYSVVLQRSATVVITATAGNVTQTTIINLEIVDDIVGAIHIEGPNVLKVPPNQTASATVTASLSDTDGKAISGIQVHFRTSPSSLGYVDSETGVTDINGRVSKTFRTIVNETGTCKVFASVGQHEDSTAIEITPRAEPFAIAILTDTPLIKVVPDQNAQIEILAVVTDEDGVGVPRATVSFTIEPVVAGGRIFGSLTPIDTTDANGEVRTTFSTLGEDGRLLLRATVLPSSGYFSLPDGDVQSDDMNSSG
ncbi:MAG TPA: hypothetical protein ENL08_00995, partial [Bacteroidetes bacterium]|nr:hypothetical protein [Bacteroidota bacterium]